MLIETLYVKERFHNHLDNVEGVCYAAKTPSKS